MFDGYAKNVRGTLFEQTVFTALSRECVSQGKKLFPFDEDSRKYTSDLDLNYMPIDAFAPDGLDGSDMPTFIAIIPGRRIADVRA